MSKKRSKQPEIIHNAHLGQFVHGGQVQSRYPDGRVMLVWGGLPDERVDVRIIKKKRSYVEAVVETVHEPSPHRIAPAEPLSYLSTSPWQIVDWAYEQESKQAILAETFERAGVRVKWRDFMHGARQHGYRNKMEFGFWGDDEGIHLAHYVRGSKGKQIVSGSVLAMDVINTAAEQFIEALNADRARTGVTRASDLKTVVFRATQSGHVVCALFTKTRDVHMDDSCFGMPESVGLEVHYSDPERLASISTDVLSTRGEVRLSDTVCGVDLQYDATSFFQVNVPVFEQAVQVMRPYVAEGRCVDMFSGVGAIGVAVGADVLVESDPSCVASALKNVAGHDIQVVQAASENALDLITSETTVIVDPPRAGMHKKLVQRLLDAKPNRILYLSCNPATQARDVQVLSGTYAVVHAQGFNFFPRTPHIESLIIMDVRS